MVIAALQDFLKDGRTHNNRAVLCIIGEAVACPANYAAQRKYYIGI